MALPEEIQFRFEQRPERYQQEKNIPLLSRIEVRDQERGRQEDKKVAKKKLFLWCCDR